MTDETLQPVKFRSAHLKVERAKRHLKELEHEVSTYLSTIPLTLGWETLEWSERYEKYYAPDVKLVGLIARIKSPIPETLPPLIGDTVHNLRSALDHMMCELVMEASPTEKVRRVCFPMWEKAADRTSKIAHSRVQAAGSRMISLIDRWEPFEGGNSWLYALAELDNLDKHRALIPSMNGVRYSPGLAVLAHEIQEHEFADPFPFAMTATPGQIYMVSPADEAPPEGMKVQCSFSLAFQGVKDLNGVDLVQGLKFLTDTVSAVLHSFEFNLEPTFVQAEPRKPAHVGNGIWMCPPEMSSDKAVEYVRTVLSEARSRSST